MKKIVVVIVLFFLTLSLTACREADLKILLPTEYLKEGLVAKFQKEYNVRVKTIPFISNEAAIVRLKGRESFDLMVPSDYAVEQLIEEELIHPIDWSKVTSLNKETSFVEPLMEIVQRYESDANPVYLLDYIVPYFWGNLGILYDATKPGLKELVEEHQWGVFLRDDLKKAVYDSSRDAFFMGLKHNGFSANTKDENELNEAKRFLLDVGAKSSSTGKTVYLTDEIMDDMISLKHDIALTYNGDAVYVKQRQKNVGYYAPEEGTNVFIDGLAIPVKSRNVDLAYAFINFISEHNNAVENTIDVTYVSAIKTVYEYMITDETSFFYYEKEMYEIKIRENDEIFRYVKESKEYMDKAWREIRAK